MPENIRRSRRERRNARGRHAITHGLLAIGHGDSTAARQHADVARRHAGNDPLALLLHAQSAQLDGNREGAQRAFRAMAEREDMRLLGLRGLFIEAQRADDPVAGVMIAEEALKLAPGSTWASQALLGFRCARGDWNGAMAILDNNLAAGLVDKTAWKRQRGVLLTARALELEKVDRDKSRDSIMEAIKLAPTLVPAAVLASKYQSEAHQVRRSMRIVETAWLAQPHPDLADAYAHVKLGDSARQRLVRIETLAAKTPGHIEGALAIARAAIDATEFERARAALARFIAVPTQRVALLMAEIERTEHGDSGRARAWTLRAVRAQHDPVWTADGYVSASWRPVSPVSGRLDAFQWQAPLTALPSDGTATIEPSPFEEAMLAAPPPHRIEPPQEVAVEPPPPPPHRRRRRRTILRRWFPQPNRSPPHHRRPWPRQRPRHRRLPNRRRWPQRPCSGRARTFPSQPRPASRPSFRSSGHPTTPGSTTNRPAASSPTKPARRRPRPAAGADSCPAGAADSDRRGSRFSCQRGRCPISGASVFRRLPNAKRWSAAIAQLVEHVIRNDGVTGSSPVCGTSDSSRQVD